MKLCCIVRQLSDITNKDTYDLLSKAAQEKGIEFITLEADNFDYSTDLESVDKEAAIYRLARGDRSSLLEILLVTKGLKGFYSDSSPLLSRHFSWGSAIRIEDAGVPIIPTIYNVSKNEDSLLKGYVDRLGGFPVILKSSGGSHGEGVMKIDSISSLRSVVGFVTDSTSSDFVLRKFIDTARHLRLVVLGSEVLDVIEYQPQADDFRTNAVAVPEVVARNDIDESMKEIAVKAVQALGLEFGGVDILIDTAGNPYVAEVNFPCNFARNQLNTGADIAGKMVEYLMRKTTT